MASRMIRASPPQSDFSATGQSTCLAPLSRLPRSQALSAGGERSLNAFVPRRGRREVLNDRLEQLLHPAEVAEVTNRPENVVDVAVDTDVHLANLGLGHHATVC